MTTETRRIVVLGAGRVGGTIARDLAADAAFDVVAVDASDASLSRLEGVPRLVRQRADFDQSGILDPLLESADLVVCAVPGPIGFQTLRRVLEAGRDVVDISFMEEDVFELDELARRNGCTAIVDCGIAPGCSNLILGCASADLDAVDRFWCAVGGLPVIRRWPWEYKAPFSPVDVIAEYTRPARLRRAGSDVALPALSDVELVDLPGVGTLEAFNTDGLRTLLRTTPVPDMVEKTLRYPGHAERIRVLRDAGFFETTPIELDGHSVRPVDVAARLLFDAWRYDGGEADLTVMRVVVDGSKRGRPVRQTFDLLDHYDAESSTSSMARTTGYTCAAAVRLLARGLWTEPGITPPELLGRSRTCFDFIMRELAVRNVVFRQSMEA